nr:MAG TPA: hypothetical protein [Caudoviricetes sp.]
MRGLAHTSLACCECNSHTSRFLLSYREDMHIKS